MLTIYDVTGRRVRILTRGSRKAGNYALRWDGLDDEGRRVASGVYLAQLVTPKLGILGACLAYLDAVSQAYYSS